jgi:hypothetical protein
MSSKDSLEYNGILVRTSLDDHGVIPRTAPLEASPDVIPVGTKPVADPVIYFTETYDQNVSKPVVSGTVNYVYVRGKNLDAIPQTGEVYLYWARQADLDNPNKWKQNQLLTAGGRGSVTVPDVPAGGIAVATDPFAWTPTPELAGTSVALLGVIATNEHPNPIPGLKSPIVFKRWIASNGEVGALETPVGPPPKPVATFSTTGHYALSNVAGEVSFTLRAVKLPPGGTVSFKCSEPDINGNPIEMPPQAINNDPFVWVVKATVKANFTTELKFDLFLQVGTKAAADNTLSVSATQTPPPTGGPVKPVLFADYLTQIKFPIAT